MNTRSFFGALALSLCAVALPASLATAHDTQAEAPLIIDVFSASDRGDNHFSFSHEASKLLIQESGLEARIRVVPFRRMLDDLAVGRSDLAIFYDSSRSREVADLVAVTVTKPTILVSRPGLVLDDLDSLSGRLVAKPGAGRYEAAFDALTDVDLYPLESYSQGIDLLVRGKVDGMIGGQFLIMNELRQVGVSLEDMGGSFVVSQRTQALHISKKSQHRDKIQLLAQTINRLRDEGRLVELLHLTSQGKTFAELTPEPQSPLIPLGQTDDQPRLGGGQGDVWTVGVENKDWQPHYRWEQGQLFGFDPAVVRHVTQSMGIDVQYESLPWVRAIEAAKAGTLHGVLDMAQTTERLPYFYFSDTYLTMEQNQIWVPANSPLQVFPGSLEELAARGADRFGVIRGIALQKDLEALTGVSTVVYDDWDTLLRSLADGRISATKGYYTATVHAARDNNTLADIRPLSPAFSYMKYYLGLSKVAVSPEHANQFSEALEAFKQSDHYDNLRQSYGK